MISILQEIYLYPRDYSYKYILRAQVQTFITIKVDHYLPTFMMVPYGFRDLGDPIHYKGPQSKEEAIFKFYDIFNRWIELQQFFFL